MSSRALPEDGQVLLSSRLALGILLSHLRSSLRFGPSFNGRTGELSVMETLGKLVGNSIVSSALMGGFGGEPLGTISASTQQSFGSLDPASRSLGRETEFH